MEPAIDLDHGDALDHRAVGRKAAVLARLRREGLPVPDGLVLPLAAVTDDREAALSAFASAVVARFDGPVAVRSSASWEDLATSARAGQTLTVLHVSGAEAVLEAARRCADSLARGDGTAGGILVQPMLDPSHAGVAFTADPVTGDRDAVRITAVEGVAEALVSGAATGIDVTVVDGRLRGDPGTLPDAHALAVADTARRIEALLGGPQDIEWAVVDGEVRILQARPITVLPVRPDPPPGGGWEKDVAHYSEPMTPFGFACLRTSTDQAGGVFARAGLLIDGMEERLVGGEVYGRVVPAVGSAEPGRLPAPPAVVLGLLARVLPPLRARTRAAERLLAGDADRWVQAWERDRDRYEARVGSLLAEDLTALPDEGLAAHHGRVQELIADGGRAHFEVFVAYLLALHELHSLLAGIDGWDEAATAALLAGDSPATRASEADIAALRTKIASSPAATAALRTRPRDPLSALGEVDPGMRDALATWLDRHGWRALNYDAGTPVLAERPALVTKLLLSQPEGPDAAGAKLAAERARARLPRARHERFDAALAEARRCYPLREDTVILGGDVALGLMRRWLLEAARRLADREALDVADDAAYLTPEEVLTALGGTADPGVLRRSVVRRRGEEAWARANPGPLMIGRQAPPPGLSALPEPLRRVNEAAMWIVGLEYPGDAGADGGGGQTALLRGVAASPGVAEGPVVIVRDHRDLDRLSDGCVLVCQVASPAWAPLFPMTTALVADGGGALSHAAIAAREHGLPAVLGTRQATSVLHEGQTVRVDGTSGEVSAVGGEARP